MLRMEDHQIFKGVLVIEVEGQKKKWKLRRAYKKGKKHGVLVLAGQLCFGNQV